MGIIMPRINLSEIKKGQKVFVGFTLELNQAGEIVFLGGFVKESMGTSATQKKKIIEHKKNKEQSESLVSNKSGDVTI